MLVVANILQPLIDVLEAVLVWLHNDLGFGWGMSIVGLTVIVRIVILPLSIKQYRSMLKMQRLQPEIKALQKKYKEDKQRMNQEMMRFYQENKVNPFSSCLPLILQLPVFIALFYLLKNDLAAHVTQTKGWLFIPDLTAPPTGAALAILIVLYIGSQLGSSLLMMTPTADKNQKRLMVALPLVFVVFIIRFPAGLIVYWVTTNVWTIAQQAVLKQLVAREAPREATVAATAGAGDTRKGPPGGRKDASRQSLSAKSSVTSAGSKESTQGTREKPPPRSPRKKHKRRRRR